MIIVAEVGINHGGDMTLAETLITLAKNNGADLVKFQLYDTGKLDRTPEVKRLLKSAELTFEQAKRLYDYGKQIDMQVFFSVFDPERVNWCEKMGVIFYKIAYSEWANEELWEAMEKTGKSIIASTNFSLCAPYGCDLLYCVPKYPAKLEDYNFKAIDRFRGLSDHTIGLDVCKIAIARGTQLVEKHFCLNHQTGADAEFSMTPAELKELDEWRKLCEKVL